MTYLRFGRMRSTLEFYGTISIRWVTPGMLEWNPHIARRSGLDAGNRWMSRSRLAATASTHENNQEQMYLWTKKCIQALFYACLFLLNIFNCQTIKESICSVICLSSQHIQ